MVFESGSVTDSILASTALPGVVAPYGIGGRLYFDGGLVDYVPASRCSKKRKEPNGSEKSGREWTRGRHQPRQQDSARRRTLCGPPRFRVGRGGGGLMGLPSRIAKGDCEHSTDTTRVMRTIRLKKQRVSVAAPQALCFEVVAAAGRVREKRSNTEKVVEFTSDYKGREVVTVELVLLDRGSLLDQAQLRPPRARTPRVRQAGRGATSRETPRS